MSQPLPQIDRKTFRELVLDQVSQYKQMTKVNKGATVMMLYNNCEKFEDAMREDSPEAKQHCATYQQAYNISKFFLRLISLYKVGHVEGPQDNNFTSDAT